MISILGAGRSSVFLIEYLAAYCTDQNKDITLCDKEMTPTAKFAMDHFNVKFAPLNLDDKDQLENLVKSSELVVSMLPAFMHIEVAVLCIKHKVNLATASYISPSMAELAPEVETNGLVFLNEMGLDPGIDHMSAMQIMDDIKSKGGKITGFKSFCGGLIADEDDGDNPWKYKFSWNPRNVVLAAQGQPAQYLENGHLKLKPYQRIFSETEKYNIEGYGELEAYPNRDSLKYLELYDLHGVKDMLRGTFRKTGYCSAWQIPVMLGMTDDSVVLDLKPNTSIAEWFEMYLPHSEGSLQDRIKMMFNAEDDFIEKLTFIGLFGHEPLPLTHGTSAAIFEEILKIKWKLQPDDKDLVVMLHQIAYEMGNKSFIHESVMVLKGEDGARTAMAKTVGLPLAIACKLLMEGKIKSKGVLAPMKKELYEPILAELKQHGIEFKDRLY